MERRRHDRYPVRQTRWNKRLYHEYPYRVLNVSREGCLIESPEPMSFSQEPRRLELPLPLRPQGVSLPVILVWSARRAVPPNKEGYLYGLRFLNIDNADSHILQAYVDFLARDVSISQIEHAYADLTHLREKLCVLAAYRERQGLPFLH
jgi:hypothetical protein